MTDPIDIEAEQLEAEEFQRQCMEKTNREGPKPLEVSGRRGLNAADKERHVWLKESDGVNRASIRKEMAQAPREERLTARAKMQHQQDLEYLRQTGLPEAGGTE